MPVLTYIPCEEKDPVIYRYHSPYRPALTFFCDKSEYENAASSLFMGVEVEFDTRDYRASRRSNKIDLISQSNAIFDSNKHIYYMNDGSLQNGLEMISQPCTLQFYRNNEEKYRAAFENIKNHGFGSDEFRSCGFHIHFNRNYFADNEDLYVENLLTLVDKFWEQLVYCSRRYYPSICRWADKYHHTPKEVVDDMRYGFTESRYHAVNLRNSKTIEFRIFKGTLDIDIFMATLELVQNFIVAAKEKSPEEIKKISFVEFLTSENLIKYYISCYKRRARYRNYDLKG